MKISMLLYCLSFSLVAMDNNNNSTTTNFADENNKSYITYESNKDKGDACILHVPSATFQKKTNMTFVHKKGIPLKSADALCILGTNELTLAKQMEKPAIHFLRHFGTLNTFISSDGQSKLLETLDMQFKKPQVRIIEANKINCEKWGIFGNYVNTNFLQMKVDTVCAFKEILYKISLYFYVSNDKKELNMVPYKAKLPFFPYVRADKQVGYF